MKDHYQPVRLTSLMIMFITAIVIFPGCPQTPPDDAVEMVVTENMTRVVYHYGSIDPLLVTVMDAGTVVRARTTTDGWHKIWWFEKGKWKIGYVKDSCLVRTPDTVDSRP